MANRRCSYTGLQQPALTGGDASKRSLIDSLWSNTFSKQQSSNQAASRRASRGNDVSADLLCSQQSVLIAMDRFVKAVNNMDATVLLPSRLRDMEVDTNAIDSMGLTNPLYLQGDLHSYFTMLNEAKNALLWGPCNPASQTSHFSQFSSQSSFGSQASTPSTSGHRLPSVTSQLSHKRQPSGGSLGSAASSDPETDNDCSSLSDFADNTVPEHAAQEGVAGESVSPTAALSNAFRVHLHALHAILQQMADSADYLATRYQNELEPSTSR